MNDETKKLVIQRELAAAAAEQRLMGMTQPEGPPEKGQTCIASGCRGLALRNGYCGGHYQDKQRFVRTALDQKKKDFEQQLPKRI